MEIDATLIDIVLSILSFALAVISVVTVVVTLKQNSKMIEGSTRAYLCIYGEFTCVNKPIFYVVIKNLGQSNALITSLKCDADLKKYSLTGNSNPFSSIENTSIAPNQSFRFILNSNAMYNTGLFKISFDISYLCNKKRYQEHFFINLKCFNETTYFKDCTDDKELSIISCVMQEFLEKQL